MPLTIDLPPADLRALEETAARLGVTPIALVEAAVHDLLSATDEAFLDAARRLIEQDAELYRRLA